MEDNSNLSDDTLGDVRQCLQQAMPENHNLLIPGLSESAIAEQLQMSVIDQVAAFTDSSNPLILPLIQTHLADLVVENLRLLRGEPVHKLTFVEDFAKSVAEYYFPLEPVLQQLQ